MERHRPALEEFLRGVLRAGRFHLDFRIQTGAGDDPDLLVTLDGEDVDLLLQRGGETLSALEYLAAKVLRLSSEEQAKLVFDCRDFRALRSEELRLIAETAADRVEGTGRPMALSPMEARERRIIHLVLKDRPGVRTESEGFGPARKVVIHPRQK
jgi:spoIIIJ-associated protein